MEKSGKMMAGHIFKIVNIVVLLLLVGCDKLDEGGRDYLKKGIELYSKGDYAAASLELKNAIKNTPEEAKPYYYMALVNEKTRQYKAMLLNLQDAVRLDPDDNEARVKLAKVELLFGNVDKALEQVDEVLSREPENLEALTTKAQILDRQKNVTEALSLLDEVLNREPTFIDALVLKAAILLKNQSFDDALALIDKGLEVDEKNISLYILKIKIHDEQNDVDAVINDYLKLLEIQPDNDAIRFALVKEYVKKDQLNEAEEVLRSLLEKEPDNLKAKLVILDLLLAKERELALKQMESFLEGSRLSDKIEFAKWAVLNNDRSRAEQLLQEVAAKTEVNKEKVSALFLLANMSIQEKDYERARKIIDNILSIDPGFVEAKVLRASVLMANNKITEAEKLLNNILWESPDLDKAMVLLGNIYSQKGELDKATQKYKDALKVNPANIQALLPIVRKEIANKHHKYARELLQRAMAKGGQRLDLLQLLVQLDLADEQWDSARRLIKVIDRSKKGHVLAQFLTGKLLAQQKKYKQAATVFKDILTQYPEQNIVLMALAEVYEKAGNHQKMLEFLDSYLKENSNNIAGYLLKSRLLADSGENKKAIAVLKDAQKIQDIPVITRETARLYQKAGRYEDAYQSYQHGLEKYPDDISLLMGLADYYEQQNQFQKAVDLYNKVLQIYPNYDVARNNLASLLLEIRGEENINKAEQLTMKFKQSENPFFLDSYAWAQFKKGNISEASMVMRKIIIKAPEIPVFRYHQAQIYLEMNDRSQAITELKKALNLAKKHRFSEQQKTKELLFKLLEK